MKEPLRTIGWHKRGESSCKEDGAHSAHLKLSKGGIEELGPTKAENASLVTKAVSSSTVIQKQLL